MNITGVAFKSYLPEEGARSNSAIIVKLSLFTPKSIFLFVSNLLSPNNIAFVWEEGYQLI